MEFEIMVSPVRQLRQDFLSENPIVAKQVEVALLGKLKSFIY